MNNKLIKYLEKLRKNPQNNYLYKIAQYAIQFNFEYPDHFKLNNKHNNNQIGGLKKKGDINSLFDFLKKIFFSK